MREKKDATFHISIHSLRRRPPPPSLSHPMDALAALAMEDVESSSSDEDYVYVEESEEEDDASSLEGVDDAAAASAEFARVTKRMGKVGREQLHRGGRWTLREGAGCVCCYGFSAEERRGEECTPAPRVSPSRQG